MAYTVESDSGSHGTIVQKLQDLLNNATITTLHGLGILQIGQDFYLAWIAYE